LPSRVRSHRIALSSFFLSSYLAHLHPHPFPTRRSSDLSTGRAVPLRITDEAQSQVASILAAEENPDSLGLRIAVNGINGVEYARSEEHTSELQSRFDLVCRLLLEKKNAVQLRRPTAEER